MSIRKFFRRKEKASKAKAATPQTQSPQTVHAVPKPREFHVANNNSASTPSQQSQSQSQSQSRLPPQLPSTGAPIPEELLPVITLINHQQTRKYYSGSALYSEDAQNWNEAAFDLVGNDISIHSDLEDPIIINICDCEVSLDSQNPLLFSISITNKSVIFFQLHSEHEVPSFYSAILLCKFEYQHLQQAYTGALLSSQAIHYSDIKTLLSPNNKNIKEEWCVVRFPFLNDKWVRCLVVVKPNNKVEIYSSSSKTKKCLLATINNGISTYTIYPNDPSQILNNSLLRVYAHTYINESLLNSILNDDTKSSLNTDSIISKPKSKSRSRANSFTITKRLSSLSLRSQDSAPLSSTPSGTPSIISRSNSRSNSRNHRRLLSVDTSLSIDTTVSDSSFSNSKVPKKLHKKSILKTHLVYLIPESHPSVKPCEIMLRLLIPLLNSFTLYGRPAKFISSKTDKNSLLFGLPQLPNTYYLSTSSAEQLVRLNMDNAKRENWTSSDWILILKELLGKLMENGWTGGSYVGDLGALNVNLPANRGNDNRLPSYDPMEDFIDRSSTATSVLA
ncbi:Protein SKG3 [Pichia kudriavzevii]|uniref:Protein SKG3 n=1 Tax=Pichia kudriavzevii TaxID=4909 RepID=A0A1V2LMQ0_PICKU|nr:Protein SKG3 [Pichia kudriavzevii]